MQVYTPATCWQQEHARPAAAGPLSPALMCTGHVRGVQTTGMYDVTMPLVLHSLARYCEMLPNTWQTTGLLLSPIMQASVAVATGVASSAALVDAGAESVAAVQQQQHQQDNARNPVLQYNFIMRLLHNPRDT